MLLPAVALCAAVAVAPAAWAASSGTLTLEGDKSGNVKGNAKGGGIKVVAVHHELHTPLKGHSPSGRREHSTLEVRVQLDKAMPILMTMWANNESIRKVEVVMAAATGNDSITLDHAAKAHDELVLSFAYQRSTWNFGTVEGMDDWP